ncbi:MFS transporter (plasmid) [Arthrobacter sp. UC242_113]|uniref:MFS transporter n=1 Tax=Arthrobacter sp. UC242_113 TaxID=3374550 RepID=UPI003757733F
MTQIETTEPLLVPNKKATTRSVIAGTFGTALEYYDFVLYGLAAALVFNTLFFPNADPAVAMLASFATYAVGFVARPVGGLILAGVGDRVGRKQVLVITIVMMGLSTAAIGLLPTYAQVGVWAPVLLILLRLVQGFGAGAELASASTLMVESAPAHRRGILGSFLCIGTNSGTLIASGVWVLVAQLPKQDLLTWGWRIPFLVSILIAGWGLWTRRHVEESHTFTAVSERQRNATVREIFGGVFTSGKKAFFSGLGLRVGEAGTSSIYQVFLVGYIATLPQMGAATGTFALMIASAVAYLTIPLIGHLSDKVGRRTVFRILSGTQLAFAVPGLLLVTSGNTALIVLAFIVAVSIAVLGMYAVESSWNAELFGSRYRLAGVTAVKELGGVLGGGIAPMICAGLMAAFHHWWPIAAYVTVLAAISFGTSFFAPETKGRDLTSSADSI